MNRKSKILMSAVLTSLIGFSGCSHSSGGTEPEASVIKTKDNTVSISVVDARSGKALDGVTVKVTAGTATDIEGNSITDIVTSKVTGLAAFYSKTGDDVKVIATKDGYVNSGSEIKVVEGINQKSIKLLKFDVNEKIPGIELAQDEVTTTKGTVNNPITVKIENSDQKPVTKITIPTGTKMTTVDGKEAVGKVTIQAVYYDDNNTESFPGGLVALAENVPADQNGSGERTTQEVNFVSAGFTAIQMKDKNGAVIKDFNDKNITIAMKLAHGTLNPESGKEVKAGDLIPIWSYDELKGKWQYEKLGKVIANPDDNNASWAVIYQASHLSYWNLDWHYSPVCKPAHVAVTDLAKGTDIITSLSVSGRGFSKTIYDYNGDGYYDLNNVPNTIPLTFALSYDGSVKDTKEVILNQNDCNVSMNVGIDTIVKKQPVKVKIVEQCSDGSKQQPLPSIPGYIWSGGAWTYASQTDATGAMQFKIAPNASESTGVFFFATGNRYTNRYVYKYIPAGSTQDQTFAFTLKDSYCTTPKVSGGAQGN